MKHDPRNPSPAPPARSTVQENVEGTVEVEEAAKEEGRGAAGDGSVELRLEEGAAPDGADKAKRVIHALVPRRQLDGGGGYIHHGTC